MRDFNFFSPYIEVKKASKNKIIYMSVAAGALVILIGGFNFWASLEKKSINQEIQLLTQYIKSNSTIERVTEVRDKKGKLEIMNQYYNITEKITQEIHDSDIIRPEIIKDISLSIPKDIYLQVMSIAQDSIQLQGISDVRTSIAEFEHNLKLLSSFEDVHVLSINRQEENRYLFTMKCSIKGDNNEAE